MMQEGNGRQASYLSIPLPARRWPPRQAGSLRGERGEPARGTTSTIRAAACASRSAFFAGVGARGRAHRTQPRRELVFLRGGLAVVEPSAPDAAPRDASRPQVRTLRRLVSANGDLAFPAEAGTVSGGR